MAGRMMPEYERPNVREVIHAPYRIIYHIVFNEVHVLVVQHGAKQLPDPLLM
jgi:toxin ParE1/3/4